MSWRNGSTNCSPGHLYGVFVGSSGRRLALLPAMDARIAARPSAESTQLSVRPASKIDKIDMTLRMTRR